MTYAARTKVPVNSSRAEIERVLMKYGADQFAYGVSVSQATIQFRAHDRVIRFVLPLAYLSDRKLTEKQVGEWERSRWRCLLLSIKAKLETTESGISTFEEEFLAHIVLPNGRTAAELALPAISRSYADGTVPPMLGFNP